MKLLVPVAKSGIAALPSLPESHTVIADTSRFDQCNLRFWSPLPPPQELTEAIVVERHVSTALTQRLVRRALEQAGVRCPIRFAATKPDARMGHMHQDYTIDPSGLLPMPPCPVHANHRYTLALTGLPGSGKTLVCLLLSELAAFSTYKWSRFFHRLVEQHYGTVPADQLWSTVLRFVAEVEATDRVAVARAFLATSGAQDDPAPFLVLDAVKSREQLITVSYALQRPAIIVATSLDEAQRQRTVQRRGDVDDAHDRERLSVLRDMGVLDLIRGADFVVRSDGCGTTYDPHTRQAAICFTEQFLGDMHTLLAWILVSEHLEDTHMMLVTAAQRVAAQRGYAATVEVTP